MDVTTYAGIAGAAATVLGAAYPIYKSFKKASKAKEDKYRDDILGAAKIEAERIKTELEGKIRALEEEFKVQKQVVSRDFSHFKDIYTNEIKVLGQRIEELRQDLGVQHSSLVSLLMKLVEKN